MKVADQERMTDGVVNAAMDRTAFFVALPGGLARIGEAELREAVAASIHVNAGKLLNSSALKRRGDQAVRAARPTNTPLRRRPNAIDLETGAARIADGVIERLSAAVVSPTLPMQTAMKVMDLVFTLSEQEHARLQEKELQDLVNAYAVIDNKSAQVGRTPSLIQENALRRNRFMMTWPCLKSREVAELTGSKAGNASATATRLKSKRSVFSIATGEGDLFPAFQFVHGEPLPLVGQVLAALPSRMTGWEIAYWFTAGNRFLNGDKPVDRFADAAAVLDAAASEREIVLG